MADFNNITGGLKVPAQIPLDVKTFALNEATLSYLGLDNNLAFTYYDNLQVFCKQEKTTYKWREVSVGEENTGLVPIDFVYPDNIVAAGVTYSNKKYNFFKIEYVNKSDEKTYSASSIGGKEPIYKDITESENHTQFNIKSIETENVGGGYGLLNSITDGTDFISIKSKTLSSDTLNIKITGDVLSIDTPSTSNSQKIYINNGYIPSYDDWNRGEKDESGYYKGDGTIGKPFTNSVKYTVSTGLIPDLTIVNSAVQNGLDYYKGSGAKGTITDPGTPQRQGVPLIIQYSGIQYNFTGDFNYLSLNITLDQEVSLYYVPEGTDQWLMDMTQFSSTLYFSNKIFLSKGAFLSLSQNGFRNYGSTYTGLTFSNSQMLYIDGNDGVIEQSNITELVNTNLYTIFESNFTNISGRDNDSNATLVIKNIEVKSIRQTIYRIGGERLIDFDNVRFSYGRIGLPAIITAKPLRQAGTSIIRSLNCKYFVYSNEGYDNLLISTLFELDNECIITLQKPLFNGRIGCLFHAIHLTDKPYVALKSSFVLDGVWIGRTNLTAPEVAAGGRDIFKTDLSSGKWDTISMNGCEISQGIINYAKIDLISLYNGSINLIGGDGYNPQIVVNVPDVSQIGNIASGAMYLDTGILKIKP